MSFVILGKTRAQRALSWCRQNDYCAALTLEDALQCGVPGGPFVACAGLIWLPLWHVAHGRPRFPVRCRLGVGATGQWARAEVRGVRQDLVMSAKAGLPDFTVL